MVWEPETRQRSRRLLRGHWLVLGDRGGLCEAVTERLTGLGHLCTSASAGPDGEITVAAPDGGRPLAEFLEAPSLPLSGVLSFGALGADGDQRFVGLGADGDAVLSAASEVFLDCLGLLRTVTATATAPVRTWLITRGAAAIEGSPPSPVQAVVAAAARCAVREFPVLACTRVDLERHGPGGDGSAADVAAVLDALARPEEADVAYRGGRRLHRRVVPAEPASDAGGPDTDRLDADGGYLVTGGLGGLGPTTARILLERGAGEVVLVGHRDDGPVRRQEVLGSVGGPPEFADRIVFDYADVTDAAAVSALVGRHDRPGRPLRGVVHAAARLSDAVLHNQDAARFREAAGAKALGAWHLHRALADRAGLEFFTSYSSATAVLGNPGQANYAAANALVDTLMEWRAGQGLPGQSLAWGPWADAGHLTGDPQSLAALRRSGMGALPQQEAEHALRALLGRTRGVAAVLANDWATWRQGSNAAEQQSFARLADAAPAKESRSARHPAAEEIVAQLRSGDRREVTARVGDLVAELVDDVLGARPEPGTHLRSLGLDSLSAVQLRNTLVRVFEIPLPVNVCLELGSPAGLARRVVDDLLAAHGIPPA